MAIAGIRIQTVVAAVLAIALVGARTPVDAGVMLQGFYKDVPTPNVATSDPNYRSTFWWDNLAARAHSLSTAGFTAVWLPPAIKGANGGVSMGYDPLDDYDIGSKWQHSPQNGSTRYGTRQQLQRLCALLKANNLDIYLDVVENHRDGDSGNRQFRYVDAYGHYPGGRFEKNPGDFHFNPSPLIFVPQDPNVPADWDPGDAGLEASSPFGADLAPVNSTTPNRYLWNGLNNAGDWLTKALDADGYRLDYVKGISTDWLSSFLSTGAMAGKLAFGEYYDGNLGKVQRWVNGAGGMNNRCSAFDFPLRYQLKAMCSGGGAFNMASLDHAGLVGVDPFHAVTFVENHDTDVSDPITANKMLAYSYILTNEGYPCVFYRDYSTEAGCYGLKPAVDPLIWIHEKIAYGRTQQRWKSGDVFAYERMGNEVGHDNLLVGLNDNGASAQTVAVATAFGANITLKDYTGHAPNVTTDGAGNATITIPANAGGAGYVCYARDGITGPPHAAAGPRETTQEFAGATDLDIRPAEMGVANKVASIWAQAGKPIRLELWYHTDPAWTDTTRLDVTLIDPAGATVATSSFTKAGPQGGGFTYTPPASGFCTFFIEAFDTPAADPKPVYWLKAHYTAPAVFPVEVPTALKVAGGLAKGTVDQAQFAGGAVTVAEAVRLMKLWSGLE
ncbi:MAG TPA: alpha-amylase family glycosyl hydrolase [Armatimonadota bacterium]|jgi:alpha-amylase